MIFSLFKKPFQIIEFIRNECEDQKQREIDAMHNTCTGTRKLLLNRAAASLCENRKLRGRIIDGTRINKGK